MLLLALAGVAPKEIAADYVLSAARLQTRHESLGEPDQGPELDEFLTSRGTSAGELIVATLASIDLEATLSRGGLTSADVGALRRRLAG